MTSTPTSSAGSLRGIVARDSRLNRVSHFVLGMLHSMATSQLTRLEGRTKPLQNGDTITLAQFETFFAGVKVIVIDVISSMIEKATELRAIYTSKMPDALYLATAILAGAIMFLAGDKELSRCTEITVEII